MHAFNCLKICSLKPYSTFFVCLSLLSAAPIFAQTKQWPNRPISLVVTYPPAGTADIMARTIAEPLGKFLGTSIIVENKPGASGQIAANYVSKSNPDGYTLMLDASSFAVNPSLFNKLPYDTLKDFKILGVIAQYPNVLLVNPGFPARSAKDLVNLAKKAPDSISYASSGNGSAQHLSGVLFELRSGVQMQHIPYKGAGLALNDVLGGQVPVFFGSVASTKQYVDTGKLMALAVTSKKRASSMPHVPTMVEAGVPEYEVYEWNAVFAPSGISDELSLKISEALAKVLQTPEVKAKILSLGGEIFTGGPQQSQEFVKSQINEWSKVIKEKKISID
ncbi:Tripartite-type tricarboxylate transporter, receptor component TctC [Polynucleobacter kasalickyi]|uniref:Tripartite-type tricarboxylate transporter, receptor component TctC n=1 Tax=Polynucleobacter kasalickyi TaxID=1938817 RepID=A0A1W2A1D4_9BURK|nr:Tripartite-type tricarboxylate transporter, receptor component TctC [Polynucleobacter kasalickyi]